MKERQPTMNKQKKKKKEIKNELYQADLGLGSKDYGDKEVR